MKEHALHRDQNMQFHEKRRQQFLIEKYYEQESKRLSDDIRYFCKNPVGSGVNEAHRHALARLTSAKHQFDLLTLKYSAGESIELLRIDLEQVIVAYESYGEYLWKYENNRNVPVFDFAVIDDYCELMQIIGLCFLLHRRDLLPRIATMQDGIAGHNGGADALFEELLIHAVGPDARYQSDYLFHLDPYEPLFYALTEETQEAALKELNQYLKNWYKYLAGCGWHHSHIPDDDGNQGGYYGYWSFEAGAVSVLLGIEDDSNLHQYLYYPKDIVSWYRANKHLSETASNKFRCEANLPCPKAGYWWTPAKENSRAYFKQNEIMPDFPGSSYGATIWQWDADQSIT